jgi:ATP-dependent 26S proteasome regulatory subunit
MQEPQEEEDYFVTYKKLQQQIEFLKVQEDYIKVCLQTTASISKIVHRMSRKTSSASISVLRYKRLLEIYVCITVLNCRHRRRSSGFSLSPWLSDSSSSPLVKTRVIGIYECPLTCTGIVGSTTGSNYYIRILSTLDHELLKPNSSVALHKVHTHPLRLY